MKTQRVWEPKSRYASIIMSTCGGIILGFAGWGFRPGTEVVALAGFMVLLTGWFASWDYKGMPVLACVLEECKERPVYKARFINRIGPVIYGCETHYPIARAALIEFGNEIWRETRLIK